MTPQSRPAFERGVRLRHDPDGAMLLVPEGALVLNPPAAATLELIDGERSIGEIAAALTERFEVSYEDALMDVKELLTRLVDKGFVALRRRAGGASVDEAHGGAGVDRAQGDNAG